MENATPGKNAQKRANFVEQVRAGELSSNEVQISNVIKLSIEIPEAIDEVPEESDLIYGILV